MTFEELLRKYTLTIEGGEEVAGGGGTPSGEPQGKQANTETDDGQTPQDRSAEEVFGLKPQGEPQQTEEEAEPKPEGEQSQEGEEDGVERIYDKFEMREGFEVAQHLLDMAKPVFGKLGLTHNQAQELINLFTDVQVANVTAASTEAETNRTTYEQTLREAWGDKYDANLNLAEHGLRMYGSHEMLDVLTQAGIVNHPLIVKHFSRLGLENREDVLLHEGVPQHRRGEAPTYDVIYGEPAK